MMSRKHSKNKRERDKSHSKKSNSERHGSNPAEKKGKTEKKLHYSGGSSPQKQTSLSSYTGKRRKRSYSEIETSTTNTEDQMKSSWTRSPDSKDKCKLVCKFDAIQSATSLGKTSSSNHENIKSKSKQKKKHRKHSREESRRENRHRSTSKKCAAARNDSGDQSHKVQRCKKCQSSIVCKHLLKCKSKPSVDNVEIGVLKTKRSSPTFESLQTHFQDYVRKSNLLQKAEEVFEKDAGKHSILEPTVVTSKFTSSCDEFRHLSKEPCSVTNGSCFDPSISSSHIFTMSTIGSFPAVSSKSSSSCSPARLYDWLTSFCSSNYFFCSYWSSSIKSSQGPTILPCHWNLHYPWCSILVTNTLVL